MTDGEKRWVKQKGCKNCAKQWIVKGIDEDGKEYGSWYIVPMVVGKEFQYTTRPMDMSKEITVMKNMYYDNASGRFKLND